MTAAHAMASNRAMDVLTWMLIALTGLLIVFCCIATVLVVHYFLRLGKRRQP